MNLICGVNPVLEALAAGTRHFDRLLIVKGLRGKRLAEAMRRATRLGIPLRFEMRETLDRLAGGIPHQGVIAIVSQKPVMSLSALLETVHDKALLVVLDGVEDPRNLGAILRTAEAAGADGVVLPDRHSAGLSETVARASAGALEHVRVARVGNLVQALEELKQRGIWVVGFDAAGGERWDSVDLGRPVALVLGGEGRGIRRLVREHCDHLVCIPHFGHVSSLNVSVAAGVALYEAVRQRRAVPSPVRPIPQHAEAAPQVVGPGPDDDAGDGEPSGVGFEGDVPVGEEDGPTAIPHLDFHEEVAWGSGPTVLKPIGFQRAHRPGDRRDKRRRNGKRGRPRPQPRREPPVPPAGNDGPRDHVGEAPPPESRSGGRDQERRRGRRRRRRGGPSAGGPRPERGAPGGPVDDAEGSSAAPGPEERSPGEGGASAPPENGGPAGRPGRRRRRRRRR